MSLQHLSCWGLLLCPEKGLSAMWTNKKHVPTRTRERILRRDRHTCQACGTTAPKQYLEVDHIDNSRTSWYDDDRNLQTLCRACHQKKSAAEAIAASRVRLSAGRMNREAHPGLL